MNRVTLLTFSVLIFITLWVLSASASSEVFVNSGRVTIKVHNASLNKVLEKIEYHGRFPIVVADKVDLKKFRISEQLEDVPLEEGLHRILLHWNYALTKDLSTGLVNSLFIASKREDVPPIAEEPVPMETVSTEEFSDDIDLQTGEKVVHAPEVPPWEIDEYQADSPPEEEGKGDNIPQG